MGVGGVGGRNEGAGSLGRVVRVLRGGEDGYDRGCVADVVYVGGEIFLPLPVPALSPSLLL